MENWEWKETEMPVLIREKLVRGIVPKQQWWNLGFCTAFVSYEERKCVLFIIDDNDHDDVTDAVIKCIKNIFQIDIGTHDGLCGTSVHIDMDELEYTLNTIEKAVRVIFAARYHM